MRHLAKMEADKHKTGEMINSVSDSPHIKTM